MPQDLSPATANGLDALKILFFRVAAGGLVPPTWFEKRLPDISNRHQNRGNLHIEIVSHCWQYPHMLLYQLSSLVLHAPAKTHITMTVYYAEEDTRTKSLLEFFSSQTAQNVTWNWQALHKHALFRRSIGRNHAAKNTQADWIWFTDCDLLFHSNCLDTLATQVQGSTQALLYPREERTTALLSEDDPLLSNSLQSPEVRDIDTTRFETHLRTRATGPLQITHGDVARAIGYCEAIAVYQKPAGSWCKAHEDRAHRWLVQSQGVAIDIPGVYRIRHIEKGRYKKGSVGTSLRQKTRAVQSNIRGE